MPTKMSPNAVFDGATAKIRTNEEVKWRFGENFKTYGRDHGGHREGHRNFVSRYQRIKEDEGTVQPRGAVRDGVRLRGGVRLDAVGGFVYVMVQDKRNGGVVSVVENRSMLLARKLAGGSDAGRDVFARLLGTGGGGGGGGAGWGK